METVLVGRYRIIQPLGSGGFGQTFLATDNYLPGQPPCVVKQFKPRSKHGDSLQTAKRLFALEAETLYRLGNHDRIPRLLAHFEQEGEFYLVQEFIKGESLQQEFNHHLPFSEAEAVILLQEVLQILVFVHEQQVIHRDIKPSNLIRRQPDQHFVLIDFGAVKQVTMQAGGLGEAELTVAVGSPGYMPPEQLASRPRFSSDIYALGVVAFQALMGLDVNDLPHDAETGEFCCAALGDRFAVSANLATVLDTMVRYDCRQRYATATDALHALAVIAKDIAPDADLPPKPLEPSSAQMVSTQLQPHQQDTRPPAQNSFIKILSPLSQHSQPVQSHQVVLPDPSSQEYRNRQALLNKVKNFWVKGVLEASLHDQVLIVLGLETQPGAVASPWNVAWASADQPMRTLPQGTQILSLFDQMGVGRSLLILGEPGSGKTITLLQLARDLIERAEQDASHLIPVVLNLSSWTNPDQPIADWIVDELNTKYQVPKSIGQTWVKQQFLLLLLDGLDEVREEARDACVVALNIFQQECSSELVICSRIQDYQRLSHRLNVQTAVYLRSLTSEQIQSYLNSLGIDLTGLKTLLYQDEMLCELAQSPLLLNLMVLAYQGMTLDDLPKTDLLVERRKQVFDAYIDRMFKHRDGSLSYSRIQTMQWLSWLAQAMAHRSQSIFLIEYIQPTWLDTILQRWIYSISSGLGLGLCYSLMFGLASGLEQGLNQGLTVGLRVGLGMSLLTSLMHGLTFQVEQGAIKQMNFLDTWIYSLFNSLISGTYCGLVVGLSSNWYTGATFGFLGGLVMMVSDRAMSGIWMVRFHMVKPVDKWKWSWKTIRSPLILWLLFGLITGILLEILHVITNGFILGLVYGAGFGLVNGLSNSSAIETKIFPNQGIWRSIRNTIVVTLISALAVIFLFKLFNAPIFLAVVFGLLPGLLGGGLSCIEHFALRITLYLNQCIPWNYAQFLNYATHLTFLQKVGGGYIFIHRLLMEHFAQITE